jgi:hypothetical protein
VPRIVLPITSRGLEVTDRVCWGILAAAMALAAGLILYLNRGTTYNIDQIQVFLDGPEFGVREIFEPVNGHLGAVTAVVYQGLLETLGAGYIPFRVIHIVVLILATGLFFALVKRRIGALPALAPTLVLLFLGSDWGHVATPLGFTVVFSVAMGLGALRALTRDDLPGDITACVLVAISVATFTTGLAFLVGVAISVLLRPDRRRRAWIFLVPLVLYAAWWLWALSLPAGNSADENTKLSNVLLIPNYAFDSLAAATAALAGLNYDFSGRVSPPTANLDWGRVLSAVAVAALVLRIRRGGTDHSLWVGVGIVLAYWVFGALAAEPLRPPGLDRYIYLGAVGVLLVATDAARSVRFSKLGLAALFIAAACSIATNLAFMRDATAFFRDAYSAQARAQFAMLELARDNVQPDFNPIRTVPDAAPVSTPAGEYMAAVDRYGSPGFSLSELGGQSETVREGADQVLASALGLSLTPPTRASEECRRITSDGPGAGTGFELPAGTAATMRVSDTDSAQVRVGRFASNPSAELGRLSFDQPAALRVPPDASPVPWRVSISGTSLVEVCALA